MFSSSKKTRQALAALQLEVIALREQVTAETGKTSQHDTTLAALQDTIAAIESRITGMGAELSRQLHELSNDIDRLAQQANDDALADTVTSLKATQIRLATEQARYEITFRQDLAALADQLLRKNR